MIQIKKRSDSKKGVRIMLTICFYQDTRHDKPLYWIRSTLGIGYLSRRNDGITELRINGFKQVESVLQKLFPYIKFKRIQAQAILKAARLLQKPLTENSLRLLVKYIILVQSENYATRKKRSEKELLYALGVTP